MKAISTLVLLVLAILFQSYASKKPQLSLPKIVNYSKGALTIRVVTFGYDNPIEVGRITQDGVIHFNWGTDNRVIENLDLSTSKIKYAVGMSFCSDKEIMQTNMEAKAADSGGLFLYKDGKQVGSLLGATVKEIEDNVGWNRHSSLILGSTLSWVYADNDVVFNDSCSVNIERQKVYNFKRSYDLRSYSYKRVEYDSYHLS